MDFIRNQRCLKSVKINLVEGVLVNYKQMNFSVSETISNLDVRDLSTNQKIPDKRYRNKYVVRANIYEAIIDPDYFI